MPHTIRDQAHPRALELLETTSGKHIDDSWRGFPEDFWKPFFVQGPYEEFLDICTRDFPTFCALLLFIVPKGSTARPFLFNRPQRLVWSEMCKLIRAERPIFLIVLKARQEGMSTFFAAWLFWHIWRKNHTSALIVAHEIKLAEHIIKMMRVAYDNLPPVSGVKPELRKGHTGATLPRGEVFFQDRGSGVQMHVAKNLDPRGMSASVILESEKAFYGENAAQLDAALLPQLPSLGTQERRNCSLIVESTPFGENHFFHEYMSAEPTCSAQRTWGKRAQIRSESKSIFLPWIVHDEEEFGGYAVSRERYKQLSNVEPRLTAEERKEQKRLSKIRVQYDGQEVTDEQMLWRRMMLEDKYHGDEEKFNMEYPSDDVSCFLMMSDSAFRAVMSFLSKCVNAADERAKTAWWENRKQKREGPMRGDFRFDLPVSQDGRETTGELRNIKFVESKDGDSLIWEPPLKGEKYCLFLDPGHGIEGADFASIKVGSVRNCREVAMYKGILNPLDAIDVLCAMGHYYNDGMINCEINQYQWTVITRAVQRNYPNLYHWQKWDEPNKPSHKLFWETTSTSRPLMMLNMLRWFENQYCAISSHSLLEELSGFQKSIGMVDEQVQIEFRQQKGMHDDEVMSWAGLLMTILQSPAYADFTPFISPPSAAELGLQGEQARRNAGTISHVIETADEAEELIAKLTGDYPEVYPANPIRGVDEGVLW